MSYTASFTLSIGTAGLTLKAALVAAGTIHATFRDVTTTFYPDGQGGYQFLTAAIPDDYRGEMKFYTGTIGVGTDFSGVVIYASASINPEELETITEIAAKTILITAGDFEVVSPVNAEGTEITLFRGDDYYLANGRALTFTSTSFPTLTGATVLLKCAGMTSITGTVTSATSVYFEISRTTTATLGGGAFEVEATLSDGHVATIATGTIAMAGQI